MAKKKGRAKESNQIPTQPLDYTDQEQPITSMDDPAEKLQSLKSLNDRLIKETHVRRKEVESLTQAKEAMEIDLVRKRYEMEKLVGEVNEANEEIFGLGLERNVVCTFVQTHLVEMGDEFRGLMEEKTEREIGLLKDEVSGLIQNLEEEREGFGKVCSERDEIKTAFDGLVERESELRGKVVEMEENERRVLEEVEKWRVRYEELMAEKAENEMAKGVLLKEKESVKRMFDESVGVIEKLNCKIDQIKKERMEIEEEKNGLEMEIENLERKVEQLNESEFISIKEKKESAKRISDLEKRIEEAVEKDNAMRMEVNNLVTQLQKKEKDIEKISQQRESLQMNLSSVQEESKDLLLKIEKFTQEKIDLEEAKVKAESIIVDLQRELRELKDAVTSLTELSKDDKAKNEELVSEIRRLGDALDRVSLERDDAQKCFSDEKKRVESLSLLLTDKEKRIEEAMDELRRMKIAQDDSLKIKNDMEKHIEVLVEERDSTKRNLLEAQGKIDEMRAEMKSVVTNSERVLALLKNTSSVLCDSHEKGEVGTFELKPAEIQPFVEHLDAIKTSFINKEKMIEEMKQLLEVARSKEREKKGFFTIVTAATTLLAAVSAVYVSRGR